MLRQVERANLSNQVFDQLCNEILSEEYRPGQRLPSERELCEILRVNRSSVREALKRLEQARLVQVRHGEGSIVLDFRFHAGFDLLKELLMPGGRVNHIAVRSILEFRSLIGPEIARLAAARIQEPELQALDRIVSQIEGCAEHDAARLQDLDFDFHYAMTRASENLALLLILNSIKEVYFKYRDHFAVMFQPANGHARELYRAIYEALRQHHAERSERLCKELIREGNELFWEHFQQLNRHEERPA